VTETPIEKLLSDLQRIDAEHRQNVAKMDRRDHRVQIAMFVVVVLFFALVFGPVVMLSPLAVKVGLLIFFAAFTWTLWRWITKR